MQGERHLDLKFWTGADIFHGNQDPVSRHFRSGGSGPSIAKFHLPCAIEDWDQDRPKGLLDLLAR